MASSRISDAFARAHHEGRLALVTFVVPGHPSLEGSAEIFDAMVEGGADIIEIGIPFSDPLADGTTIQRVAFEALEGGMTPPGCMQFAREARERHSETAIVFMTYLNPVLAYGVEAFARDAAAAGVDAVILTDLPPEEAGDIQPTFAAAGLDLIYLVAPTSSDERIRIISEHAGGFVYCVSVTGITGARDEISADLPDYLARVRHHTSLPLVVGFGISRREHIEALTGVADGAVVASALMNLASETAASSLKQAMRDAVEILVGRRSPDGVPTS